MLGHILNREIKPQEIKQWLLVKQPINWKHYCLAGLGAYLLTGIAFIIETFLSWNKVLRSISHWHSEMPMLGWHFYLIFGIPAAISYVLLLPFLRFPNQRRIAMVAIVISWTYFLYTNHADCKGM